MNTDILTSALLILGTGAFILIELIIFKQAKRYTQKQITLMQSKYQSSFSLISQRLKSALADIPVKQVENTDPQLTEEYRKRFVSIQHTLLLAQNDCKNAADAR